MRISKLCLKVMFLVLAVVIVTGCSSAASPATKTAQMPDFVSTAPQTVKDAYAYTVTHQAELAKYPCFCGCGSMGHTSNLSCYVKSVAPDGAITYDNHASGCGICVDITQDVMRLKAEGQSSQQVRTYIDSKYSAYGPSTNTPLPQG
jgi:hypothetical protein